MSSRRESENPFASPLAEDYRSPPPPGVGKPTLKEQAHPCPRCGANEPTPAPYHWFRGRRGPRAIDHLVCEACGAEYNGETGVAYPPAKSPVLFFVLAVVLFVLYFVASIALGV